MKKPPRGVMHRRGVELQCERIAAARQAAERVGVAFVINARVDTWLRQVSSGQERIELTIARACARSTSCIEFSGPLRISWAPDSNASDR